MLVLCFSSEAELHGLKGVLSTCGRSWRETGTEEAGAFEASPFVSVHTVHRIDVSAEHGSVQFDLVEQECGGAHKQ